MTVAGNIGDGAGNGYFLKDLDGSLILTGDTTLTGRIRIDGGLSSVLQIGNGGTTGSVTSEIDNRGLVVFNRSNAYTHRGVISTTGAGTVRQAGTGTTTFTGDNSYLGETQVNAGTSVIDGDQSAAIGAVVVASGATLAGTGTIGGATTISGTHGPGNSAGIQTFLSDLSCEAGAVIDWELVSNTPDASGTRGTDFDGINVGGGLSFNGATTMDFNFSGSVDFANSFWTTDGASETWSVFTGATSVNSLGNLSFNVNGATAPGTFTITNNGSDVFLNYSFSAVPEPTTFAMLGLGLSISGFGRRRKKIKSVSSKA
ncbi:MAG: PEP-CTERM sorting domain-containing protein [Pirellulales bacterium]